MTDTTAQTDQHETDAVKAVVAVEHAQNNERPDDFLGLFREDAVWTTGGGKRLYGRTG